MKKICVILKEYITFDFELTKSTEPLLKEDLKEVKFQLPFENFTESAHPNVIQNESHFIDLNRELFSKNCSCYLLGVQSSTAKADRSIFSKYN